MITRPLGSLLLVSVIGVGLALTAISTDGPRLIADPDDPHADSDGDLLPNHVEWVLALDHRNPDTDFDGVDDFLHAVQQRLWSESGTPMIRSYDHELRSVASLVPNENETRDLWLSYLFRFAGNQAPTVPVFDAFVEDRFGVRHSLAGLLGQNAIRVLSSVHPQEGRYVLVSINAVSETLLRSIMPCTIGVQAIVGGKPIISGTYIQDTSGHPTTFLPISENEVVIQPLAQDPGDGNPFWTTGRVCVCRLSVIGRTATGIWAEITSARCERRGRLVCPQTCDDSEGDVVHFSDGIGILTGG